MNKLSKKQLRPAKSSLERMLKRIGPYLPSKPKAEKRARSEWRTADHASCPKDTTCLDHCEAL